MADGTLTSQTAASTLTGTETVYGVQSGSKKITTAQIATLANTAPSITGIETHAGTNVYTAAAMAALAIDVTKALNTKSISADSTFTFSGTPANSNQWFGMLVTNTDTASHVLTIPSSFSVNRNAAITAVTIPLSSKIYLQWQYDGSVYNLYGDPVAQTGTGSYVLGTSPTITTPTVTGPVYTSAAISALDIDWAAGTSHYKTLAANSTFTFSNAANGRQIVVALTNTASNYTVAWPTVVWTGGAAPTQTVGAKTDVYTFIQINSIIYGSAVQDLS